MELPSSIFTLPVSVGPEVDLGGYPLFYRSYDIRAGAVGSAACLFVIGDEGVKIPSLVKIVRRLQEDFGKPCIVASPRLTRYQMDRLSEEGIAWMASPGNMLVPFVGLAVREAEMARPAAKKLSPQAQRLATHIVDGSWAGRSATEIAGTMQRSLASVGNYFKEIEAAAPEAFESRGRTRLVRPLDGEERGRLLEKIEPYLASPVAERAYFRFDGDPVTLVEHTGGYAGISALSRSTMLADDPWLTLAAGPSDRGLPAAIRDRMTEVSKDDGPDLLLETWQYPTDAVGGSVNEVSLYLSLKDNPDDDPRLEGALDELKEAIFA